MTELTEKQAELCETNTTDFSDLSALFLSCTLKRSPEVSNTEGLAEISMEIMRRNGVAVELVRAVDQQIATGVYPDMTEHGWPKDDWPALFEKVMAADILVLLTPIWLGEKSSICTQVIERLYGNSSQLNEAGQYAYYGRVGGCLVTGNEDGIKHCAMNVLYSLQHLGYVIPPQADAGWLGEAGPGPSYLDADEGGRDNDFTNRNTTFMTWNLLHMARMVKDDGGIPAHGNQRWPGGTPAVASTSPTPSTASQTGHSITRWRSTRSSQRSNLRPTSGIRAASTKPSRPRWNAIDPSFAASTAATSTSTSRRPRLVVETRATAHRPTPSPWWRSSTWTVSSAVCR